MRALGEAAVHCLWQSLHELFLYPNENEASFLFRKTAVHPGSSHRRHLERPQHWPKSWKRLVSNTHRLSFCLFVFVLLICFASTIISLLGGYHRTAKGGGKRQLEAKQSPQERPVSAAVGYSEVLLEETWKIETASDSEWMLARFLCAVAHVSL